GRLEKKADPKQVETVLNKGFGEKVFFAADMSGLYVMQANTILPMIRKISKGSSLSEPAKFNASLKMIKSTITRFDMPTTLKPVIPREPRAPSTPSFSKQYLPQELALEEEKYLKLRVAAKQAMNAQRARITDADIENETPEALEWGKLLLIHDVIRRDHEKILARVAPFKNSFQSDCREGKIDSRLKETSTGRRYVESRDKYLQELEEWKKLRDEKQEVFNQQKEVLVKQWPAKQEAVKGNWDQQAAELLVKANTELKKSRVSASNGGKPKEAGPLLLWPRNPLIETIQANYEIENSRKRYNAVSGGRSPGSFRGKGP
ncbi:MAG: hypothetical protein VX768_13220, partial [Planctomycetota bacterium]|nr:hypothetical protein [Planctomycetota bacterium]